MNDSKVDLKICEGCGALWLRRAMTSPILAGVYCKRCAVLLAELPAQRRNPAANPPRTRRNPSPQPNPRNPQLTLIGGAQ